VKKNVKTYLLLALVLFIWGVIGYKVLSSITPEPEENTLAVTTTFKPQSIKEKDTFSIIADYRDPFLGTVKKKTIKKRKPTVKKNTIPEITVAYTGHISGASLKEKVFFVTINGKQELMSINNTINDVTLISGSKTKIKVSVKKKIRTIPLQE